MAEPVTGSELKMRGYETPQASSVNSDARIVADSPTGGPIGLSLPDLVTDGVAKLPAPPGPLSELSNAKIPVMTGGDGAPLTMSQYPLADVASGTGSMYLGPKDAPPTADNFGGPLRSGHTYYNLNDETLYIWISGGRWAISAASLPSAMRAYYYSFASEGSIIPPNGAGSPDAYGNILKFDVSSDQASVSGVNLYLNGVLLMNGVDYVVHEGGAAFDYITLTDPACASAVAVIQVFSTGANIFRTNSVKADTSVWAPDGTATEFPLVTSAGEPIFPNNATNCLVSVDDQIIEPNVSFQINSDKIVFTAPLPIGSVVWVVVGVPTSGAAGEAGPRVTPWQFGGVGDGVLDDSDAVEAAIDAVNATKATLDLAGGIWRITRQMPSLFYPRVDGGGSGEIYVDYNMAGGTVIDCISPIKQTYTVTAISIVDYDFEGAFSATSKVTRLTLTLAVDPETSAVQPMPEVGDVGKVSATDALVGVEVGDSVGQHIAIVAIDTVNKYVYAAGRLYDTYATAIQLQLLDQRQVLLRNFGMRANWARLLAEDWLGTFVRVLGGYVPKCNDLWFRNGTQGLVLAGTFMAGTRGIRVGRMRNATASETPPIPGYGVVDAGSFLSQHQDIGGFDCRHVYTTISPDASGWPRVAWGRAIKPVLNGGEAHGCSAAAFDTHSDCLEPIFDNLQVNGGYYGQNSAGAGIQLRGIRGIIRNCRVRDTAVGYEIYKQFVGEENGHRIEDCSYHGTGTPIRAEHEDTLTGANARQTLYIGDFVGVTTGQVGIDLLDADAVLVGNVKIVHSGSQTSMRAVYERALATIRSEGGAVLLHDITGVSGPVDEPRMITFAGSGCGAAGLLARVIAGGVAWQAVVSENDVTAAPVAAGAFRIDCDCDLAPNAASGGYSAAGVSNLLPVGGLILHLTINWATTQAAKTVGFTLNASMHRQTILCNGTFTVVVPAATILGPDFRCQIVNVSGTITLDGPGGTNPTIPAGSRADVQVVGASTLALIDAMQTL